MQVEARAAVVAELRLQLAAALHRGPREDNLGGASRPPTAAVGAPTGAVNEPGVNGKVQGEGNGEPGAVNAELAAVNAQRAGAPAREEAMGAAHALLEARSRELEAALAAAFGTALWVREPGRAGAEPQGRQTSSRVAGAASESDGREAPPWREEGGDGRLLGGKQNLQRGHPCTADAPPPQHGLFASGFYKLTASVQKCAQPPQPAG